MEDSDMDLIPETGEVRDENTFKILIASDIHLGYNDSNPAREDDSFVTFEEILQIGLDENVDFVLLGGDLFHENKPQPATLHRAMEILRKYCLGSKAVEFEYLGDPTVDFPNQDEPEINYQNPDINIALPVFTIHGNHDDPIGVHKTSAVDHLVAAKLLNHFGQWDDLNSITVRPVPLVKGETKLALYGLGNVKDERLFRLMRDQNVKFVRPKESQDDWFNVFVLHQNRVKHGPKNYIPESFLPGFLDLAIWGHEHECRIQPEKSEADFRTYIIQPGSSVATSLIEGEAKEKFVGVLHINRRRFRLEKKKLRTVRPLMIEDVIAKEVLQGLPKGRSVSKTMEAYLDARIKQLVDDSTELLTGHEKQPVMPLVRVRVIHESPEQAFHPAGFSQRFVGQVVNDDIVQFKKIAGKRSLKDEMDVDQLDDFIMVDDAGELDSHVEKIVEDFFKLARENGEHGNLLEVLSERGLSEAVKSSVEKNDKEALSVIIESQMEKAIQYLINKKVDDSNIMEELEEFKARRLAHPDEESAEVQEMLQDRPVGVSRANGNGAGGGSDDEEDQGAADEDNEVSLIEEDDDDDEPVGPRRGGRGRGRGARGGAAAGGRGRGGRGRGKNSGNDSSVSPPKARGRGRAAASTSRGRGRDPPGKADSKKNLVQTTLQVRRSPRKAGGAMTFDVSDSD